MIENIHYLVGPNGTGKTRALKKLSTENKGIFIPKERAMKAVQQFAEGQTIKQIQRFQQLIIENPEQIAMALLRENASLRYNVFSILSQKLGRTFSVEIVERSQHFKITAGLNDSAFEEVTIQRYGLEGESSGLRELLILLTLIHSKSHKKYFIDEPELSLHPEAQRFLKNEMLRLAETDANEFWLATHSPIFFSPESIAELDQAVFYSDPQKEGTPPIYEGLTAGQINHLDKSLLRLDSEKWLLAHAKAAIFCEGTQDKAIFKSVLRKSNIDLSRHDLSLIECGGKDDFSTLFILCKIINKEAYYIGDLDCLIECKLLDKYDDNEVIKAELRGITTDIQQYISNNIKQPLGELTDEFLKITSEEFKQRDTENCFLPHLDRIRTKTNNSKSLTLELINKYPDQTKSIIGRKDRNSKIDNLTESTAKAISILQKVGVFIIPTGALETFYHSNPVTQKEDKHKIDLFNEELEILSTEPNEVTTARYKTFIDFISSISPDEFDKKTYMREELTKILSTLQTIIITEKPQDVTQLTGLPKYVELKIGDLLNISSLVWDEENFVLIGESIGDFDPGFKLHLDSSRGITNDVNIEFHSDLDV